MGFPYFVSYLPTLLLSVMYAIIMWRFSNEQGNLGRKRELHFFGWTILYLVVMKGSFLVEYSTSPDEHQWIFSAKAFASANVTRPANTKIALAGT